MEKESTKVIPMKRTQIEIDERFLVRQHLDGSNVARLVRKIQNGVTLDPLTVASIKGFGDRKFPMDGRHRLAAYEKCGINDLGVIDAGTFSKEEFLRRAAELNDKHGLPLSDVDRELTAAKLQELGVKNEVISQWLLLPLSILTRSIPNVVISRGEGATKQSIRVGKAFTQRTKSGEKLAASEDEVKANWDLVSTQNRRHKITYYLEEASKLLQNPQILDIDARDITLAKRLSQQLVDFIGTYGR